MFKRILLIAVIAIHISSICQAAIQDAGVGEYYKKEQELYKEPSVPNKDTVVNKAETPINQQQNGSVRIAVSKIITSKSEILTDAELREITAKYEGQDLSITDLYQAVAEINELFKKKSYITAKAILPPQKIENGVVKIQVVEGRIGEIQIEGNKHTNGNYIKDRISMHSGELLKLEQLQKDIFFFNNTNDVALTAELKPGKEAGTTDCIFRLQEPEKWQTTMFSDNAGQNESGMYRIGMVIANNSLFGNRESLILNPTWTKGTMAGSASFTFPMNRNGTKVGISYSKNQTSIISGPYETMDIAGDSADIGLSITQPLVVEVNRKVEGYAELHWKDSTTDFSGLTAQNSQVKTVTVGSSIRTLDDKGAWYSQYSATAISADKKDFYNGRQFYRFNISAIRQQALDNENSLLLRLSGQLSNSKDLPSSERFSLGGMSSVKGYTEGRIDGDQGFYAGVEYTFPLHTSKTIRGMLFFDHGTTYNSPNTGVHSRDYLTSTGIGVVLNYSPDFFGKLVVGFPLNSSKEHETARTHFFLQTNL